MHLRSGAHLMNFLLLLLPTLVVAPWYNDQVIKVGTDCKAKGWNTVLSFCTEFGEPGYPHTYWICIIHENTLHGKATFQLRSCGTSPIAGFHRKSSELPLRVCSQDSKQWEYPDGYRNGQRYGSSKLVKCDEEYMVYSPNEKHRTTNPSSGTSSHSSSQNPQLLKKTVVAKQATKKTNKANSMKRPAEEPVHPMPLAVSNGPIIPSSSFREFSTSPSHQAPAVQKSRPHVPQIHTSRPEHRPGSPSSQKSSTADSGDEDWDDWLSPSIAEASPSAAGSGNENSDDDWLIGSLEQGTPPASPPSMKRKMANSDNSGDLLVSEGPPSMKKKMVRRRRQWDEPAPVTLE